jgi:hypothetical protein
MNTRFQFRTRLAADREILSQQATLLPGESARPAGAGGLYTPQMLHLSAFLPVFKLNREDLTVAHPLLKEVLR